MARRKRRHTLATGHRLICRCGRHDEGHCPQMPSKGRMSKAEGEAKVKAVRSSTATSEAYRGTSEVSRAEDYAAKAALGIIGSDQ